MPSRKLRIVKHSLPAIGICERCNSQFKFTGTTETDAKYQIKSAFDAHKCVPLDSSQNALRIVRESTVTLHNDAVTVGFPRY